MSWHEVSAHFFAGMFVANFVPHFVAGVSGRAFPSPFGSPPFRGLSSPAVNVLWGTANLAVAYVLLVAFGSLDLRRVESVAIWAAGFTLTSVALARKLSKLQGGSP